MKKLFALMLCAVLLACSLNACKSNSAQQNSTNPPLVTQSTTQLTEDTTSFKLSYSQTDSLNPFLSQTLNNQVLQELVFDSLFILDESYRAVPSIASGYAFKDKTTLLVTIPSGISFSDGKRLTADDVVTSFRKAKESPRWKQTLAAFDSATAESDTVIRFRLNAPNPNAPNLLTFAIAAAKNDKNGYPIGSGRYCFGEGNGAVYLTVNPKHPDFTPHLTKITLINITAAESIDNAMNIGNISFAYRDMSAGTNTKIHAAKKAVNLTNLVFLGINSMGGITQNAYIRQAISLALDRDTLIKSAYHGYGKAALSVFHPASAQGKETAVFQENATLPAAKQAIAQSGYSSKQLTLDLLTTGNENNLAAAKLIQQQLETVGFHVIIHQERYNVYQEKLKQRRFHLYIGEIKLTGDMGLQPFFSKKGTACAGIPDNIKSKTAYYGYLASNNSIGKFMLSFAEELPFIPLLYRQGMLCYSKSMHGDMQGYTNQYFANIEDWYFN